MRHFLQIIQSILSLDPKSLLMPFLFCLFVGFAFLAAFDISILNPTTIGWLGSIPEGDLRQHYLGWVAIRQAETLGTPLGTSPLLAYPFGAPITSTDSNPLVSFLLWPIADFLPTDFQFIGLWYLLSLTLSLLFASKLMQSADFDKLTALLLGAVLAFQPILYWRYGHDTLTAQWTILASMFVCFAVTRVRSAIFAHGILLILAISIHPYLFVMLAIIAGFDVLVRMIRVNGVRFGTLERSTLLFAATFAGSLYVGTKIGVFALQNSYQHGVGFFSADPIGFLNPFDASRLMPQLPAGEGQYEGFAYLGLGGLILCIVVLVLAIRGVAERPKMAGLWPMILSGLVAFAIAVSPTVTVLGSQVVNLDLSSDGFVYSLFSKLRSSGRFIWVTVYVLFFVLLASLPKNRKFAVRSFAVFILAAQYWDIKPLTDRIQASTAYRSEPISVFDEPDWKERIARAEYIYMSRSLGLQFSLDVGAAAFPLQTPLTWFYTAQGLGLPRQVAAEEQMRIQVLSGSLNPNALYILDNEFELALVHRNATGIQTTHQYEGFTVVETAAYAAQPDIQTKNFGLTELLEWCNVDCTALMVAHGDASAMLSAQVKLLLNDKGGRLSELSQRMGYVLILRDGVIVEEVLNLEGDASANVIVDGQAVSLLSSVTDLETNSLVSVDGINFVRNSRGMSVLLIKDDGRLVSAAFDTSVVSDSLYPDKKFHDLLAAQEAGAIDQESAVEEITIAEIEAIAGPVSAEPFVNLKRVLTRGSSLLDVLSRCRQDCTMAISVKDEGSASLPLAVRAMARHMGLVIAELGYRDGFAAIVENGIVLVQGRSFDETVDVSEIVEGRSLRVQSAGFEAGNLSSIKIDGEEQSLDQRGINIVVLIHGERVIRYHFDTHGGW